MRKGTKFRGLNPKRIFNTPPPSLLPPIPRGWNRVVFVDSCLRLQYSSDLPGSSSLPWKKAFKIVFPSFSALNFKTYMTFEVLAVKVELPFFVGNYCCLLFLSLENIDIKWIDYARFCFYSTYYTEKKLKKCSQMNF